MAADGLKKQVVEPTNEVGPELVALKRKINVLLGLYIALFGTSLVLIVMNSQRGAPQWSHYAWAFALGGAVITRLIRQSLVQKYNRAIMGGAPTPIA